MSRPELLRELLHETFDPRRPGREGRGAYALGFKLADDRLGRARGVRIQLLDMYHDMYHA